MVSFLQSYFEGKSLGSHSFFSFLSYSNRTPKVKQLFLSLFIDLLPTWVLLQPSPASLELQALWLLPEIDAWGLIVVLGFFVFFLGIEENTYRNAAGLEYCQPNVWVMSNIETDNQQSNWYSALWWLFGTHLGGLHEVEHHLKSGTRVGWRTRSWNHWLTVVDFFSFRFRLCSCEFSIRIL